eukprot:1555147-Amphidinium_carterae.1
MIPRKSSTPSKRNRTLVYKDFRHVVYFLLRSIVSWCDLHGDDDRAKQVKDYALLGGGVNNLQVGRLLLSAEEFMQSNPPCNTVAASK